MRQTEVQLLADAVRRDFAGMNPATPEVWDAPPPVKVIDCVLSLNRPYRTVVWPRVEAFASAHRDVLRCVELRALIGSFGSPTEFMRRALNTRDSRRAATLVGVVDYVIAEQERFDGATDDDRLRAWAKWARPGDYLAVGVRGFGLAGFQYLRMLFGADTVKPDVHVLRYVARAVSRKVSDIEALYLVESAAKAAGVSVARLDGEIWSRGAAGPHLSAPPCAP
ncbi:MAG: hypothetical protein KJZ54_10380 [Phycisphaerales bacterium]|nr:hypothetical protein [Phycisphaerales bacterium]